MVWRGNWDKNAIESHFMPLDHRCYVIRSNIVLSDNIFHVIGSDVILLDHIFHVIGSGFMPLDRTLCHWIGLHAIGSDFMPLDRTSCHWIKLHVIGSDFMSLDHIILLDRFHFIGALLSGQRFIIRNNISQNAFRHKVPRVQTGLKWFQLIP